MSEPLPDTGTVDDFKSGVFRTVPPRPYYPLRPARRASYLQITLMIHFFIWLNFLGGIALRKHLHLHWYSEVSSVLAILIQWTSIRSIIKRHRKTEQKIAEGFYKMASILRDCTSDHPTYPCDALTILDQHRQMANAIRRSKERTLDGIRAFVYNITHFRKRQCYCCHLTFERSNKIVKKDKPTIHEVMSATGCPFCGWKVL